MAERNSVVKLLKGGKLSEKPCAGGKSNIWQDFVYWFNSDYMSLFWEMLHSKLTSFLLIYHNLIIEKMSYQAEWNGFVGWIWPAGQIGKRPLAYISASYVLISI